MKSEQKILRKALELACYRIADSGQEYHEANTKEGWMKVYIEQAKKENKYIGIKKIKHRNFYSQTLLVKCPECDKFNDLGVKACDTYNASFAFMLNKECVYCGILFDESDTNEADYKIIEFKDC